MAHSGNRRGNEQFQKYVNTFSSNMYDTPEIYRRREIAKQFADEFEFLSEEEEKDIIDRLKKNPNDIKARNRVIMAFQNKVVSVCKQLMPGHKRDQEDAIQEATFYIIKAIDRVISPDCKADTFAGAIILSLQKCMWEYSSLCGSEVVRNPWDYKTTAKVRRFIRQFEQEHQRKPTDDELFDYIKDKVPGISRKEQLADIRSISIDQTIDTGEDEYTFAEVGEVAKRTSTTIDDENLDISDMTGSTQQFSDRVEAALRGFSDMQRDIVITCLELDKDTTDTYKKKSSARYRHILELAKKYDLSPTRINQILRVSLERIKSKGIFEQPKKYKYNIDNEDDDILVNDNEDDDVMPRIPDSLDDEPIDAPVEDDDETLDDEDLIAESNRIKYNNNVRRRRK